MVVGRVNFWRVLSLLQELDKLNENFSGLITTELFRSFKLFLFCTVETKTLWKD